MHFSLLFLLTSIVLPIIGINWKVTDTPSDGTFERADLIRDAGRAMEASGLARSLSSRIEVSGSPVASIYHAPGCPGLLLVVPLPPTAQRFEHVVPALDTPASAEGYVYRGQHEETYPAARRVLGIILADLRLASNQAPGVDSTVFAYREIGLCGLSNRVNWSSMALGKE